MIDGAPGPVGNASEMMMEHLVIDDALQEKQRYVAPIEHRMDPDEAQNRIVASEGEASAAGASAPAAPADGNPQAAGEKTRVQPVVDLLQVVHRPARDDGRQSLRLAAHAVQV